MLHSFSANWYKPFTQITIPELSRITLVGGKNNTGKTSLLEAMFLFFDRRNSEMFIRSLGWRGFQRFTGSIEQIVASSYHDYELASPITLSANLDGEEFHLSYHFRRSGEESVVYLDEYEEWDPDFSSSSSSGPAGADDRVELELTRGPSREHVAAGRITAGDGKLRLTGEIAGLKLPSARYQGLRIRPAPSEDAELLGALEIDGEAEALQGFARGFFPNIKSLVAVSWAGSPMIYADVGLPRKIPLPALGDGAARLVSYYLTASSVRGGVLLLDEVGSGLHYTLFPKLWSALRDISARFDCQIVATTHSHECLAAAARVEGEALGHDFRYVRLDANPHSRAIEAVSYDYEEFTASIEQGWELR